MKGIIKKVLCYIKPSREELIFIIALNIFGCALLLAIFLSTDVGDADVGDVVDYRY